MTGYTIIEFLAIAAIVGAIVVWYRRTIAEVSAALKRQASLRGGTVKPASIIAHARLLLDHKGTEILVSAMPGGGSADSGSRHPSHSYAHFYIDEHETFELTLTNKSLGTKIEELLGHEDILTGNRAFDERFYLRANDNALARALFDAEIQQRLLAFPENDRTSVRFAVVHDFTGGRLNLELKRPRLSVSVERIATDDETWSRLIEIATDLHDRLARAAGSSSRAAE